jgi:hypothetical protein
MTAIPALLAVRRAACAISAGPFRATGWVVSTKALLVTSHSALGYHVEVNLENEVGEHKPGRVVAVDVARDLAFVLATDGLPRHADAMMPLQLREMPAVKLGERVHAVAALPGRGLRIWPASICSLPRASGAPGSSERFDTDVGTVGPAGGPLVDAEGRAVAILVRDPRQAAPCDFRDSSPGAFGAALPATPGSGGLARASLGDLPRLHALPASELRTALRPIEAASDLQRRSPVYRCPACTAPFVPDHDACLACGSPLPHPFAPEPSRAAAERAVRDALAAAGVVANRVRTGPRSWHVPPRLAPGGDAAPVTVELDETGTTVALRAPVSLLPRGSREPFFRLLLTLNDQSTGPYRLALDGDRVVLLFALFWSMLRDQDLTQTLAALGEMAEHYRKILQEGFDAAPLLTMDAAPDW